LLAGAALVAIGLAVFKFVPFERLLAPQHEAAAGPLEAKVTLSGGSPQATELLHSLMKQAGGIVLDADLERTLGAKTVTVPPSTEISLRAAMDLIFGQLGVDVDYTTNGDTVVVKRRGANR
jgi:hypothetical protein